MTIGGLLKWICGAAIAGGVGAYLDVSMPAVITIFLLGALSEKASGII